jgi:predicted CopG family antitoxin
MATKTISLKLEAWERLRRARRSPTESYSEVVMRAQWPEIGVTAQELLDVYGSQGPQMTRDAVDRIDAMKAGDQTDAVQAAENADEGQATEQAPEDEWGWA